MSKKNALVDWIPLKKCIWSAVPNEGEFVLHLNLTTFLSAKYDINYYLACWYLILEVVLNLLFRFAQPQSDLLFDQSPAFLTF